MTLLNLIPKTWNLENKLPERANENLSKTLEKVKSQPETQISENVQIYEMFQV